MKSEGRHGGQAEGEMCFTLAPDRTIIRLGRLPSWEAGRGANNYSLFTRPGSRGEQQKKRQMGGGSVDTDTEQVRARSPNPSPTHRLGKPDPLRLTEHTKCSRYFWAFMLS